MSATLSEKLYDTAMATQQPTPSDESAADTDSDVEIMLDEPVKKDAVEVELEKLVFGDETALKLNLKNFNLLGEDADESTAETSLQGVADADLFFTDDGDNDLAFKPSTTEPSTIRPSAWEDSEDERTTVSLASVPRLRKLRRTAEEDVVDGVEYTRRLRQQYEVLNPRPQWAVVAMEGPAAKRRRLSQDDSDSDMDSEGELPEAAPLSKLLTNASSLMRGVSTARGKRRKLRPETINILRTKDIPGVQPSAITSLSFHPSYPLMLSSGPASTLYMHHITPSPPAPTTNPLLVSMHIRNTPLTTTAFCPNDSRIFLSSRRKYMHIWDLDSGKVEKITQVIVQKHEQSSYETFRLSPDGQHMALQGSSNKGGGNINILKTSTLQLEAQAHIDGRHGIASYCWWRNSQGLTILGKNGEVSEYSLQKRAVIAKWEDEGAVNSTVMAMGGQHEMSQSPISTDRWIAIGSSSGIVNVYDRRAMLVDAKERDTLLPVKPKPLKTLDNLLTPISTLTFSPDGQVLAMASKWKKDALRLVHLPSATVYKNWPTSQTPLGRITAVAFADGEIVTNNIHSVLAVANEQGKIRMWEIS